MGHTNHLNFVMALPWLPLLMLAVYRMSAEQRSIGRWWMIGVACLAMLLLSGGIPILFLAGFLLIWAAFALPCILNPPPNRLRAARRLLCRIALMGLAAAGLTAVQWLPTLDLYSGSARADWDAGEIGLGTIPWRTAAAQLFAPGVLGDLVTQALFHLDHESAIFIGGLGLSFAIIALIGWRTHSWTPALAVLASGAILLASRETFERFGLQAWLPIKLRQPARFVCLFQFALALLAGIGFQCWRRAAAEKRWIVVAMPAIVSLCMATATLGLLSWLAQGGATPESFQDWLSRQSPAERAWLADLDPSLASRLTFDRTLVRSIGMAVWCAAGAAACLATIGFMRRPAARDAWIGGIAVIELALFSTMTWIGRPQRPDVVNETISPIVSYLKDNLGRDRYYLGAPFPPLWGNRGAIYGLANAVGYTGSMLNVSREHAALMDPRRTTKSAELLALFGVKYIVLFESSPPPGMREVFACGGYRVYENPAFAGQACFVRGIRHDSAPSVLEAILADGFAARDRMFLVDTSMTGDGPIDKADTLDRCDLLPAGAGQVRIRTRCTDDRSLLLSVSHDSGWRATLDGKPIFIQRADGCFMGFRVPPGTHDIALAYFTPRLIPGLLISISTLLVLTIIAMIRKFAHRLRDSDVSFIQGSPG